MCLLGAVQKNLSACFNLFRMGLCLYSKQADMHCNSYISNFITTQVDMEQLECLLEGGRECVNWMYCT